MNKRVRAKTIKKYDRVDVTYTSLTPAGKRVIDNHLALSGRIYAECMQEIEDEDRLREQKRVKT